MKKPIYILYASVINNIDNETKTFTEIKLERPLRFFAVPQRGDVIFLENKKYLVHRLIYSAQHKNTAQPTFYGAAYLYLKELDTFEEFQKVMFE